MGSLREEEEEDEESRPERYPAGLEPEVTAEGSARTLRGGGSDPAAVGAVAEAQRTCEQRLPPASFSSRLSPAHRLILRKFIRVTRR